MVAGLGIEESPTANKSNFATKVSTPNLEQIRSRMAGCFDSFPHQFYFDWEAKRNTYSAIAAGFLVRSLTFRINQNITNISSSLLGG